MNIAKETAKRSTCLCFKTAAVAVKDRRILATGYNGAPRKTLDCIERGECLRRKMDVPSGHRYELCRSVHAEMNTIINAARAGISLDSADLYLYGIRVYNEDNKETPIHPCFICKKMIINAGIKRVIAHQGGGKMKTFDVEDWVRDWQHKDMLEDMDIYDSKYHEVKGGA